MVKNNVYYEWFASITVPNPDQVGYWVDLGADSKGRIIKKTVAVNAIAEKSSRFNPFFLKIKKITKGNNAIACGLVKMPIARVTAESSGLDLNASISESTRKNV